MKQFYLYLGVFLILAGVSMPAAAQRKQTAQKASTPKAAKKAGERVAAVPKQTPEKIPDAVDEKAQFEAATAAATPAEKAELLIKFIADHPKSELISRARESLSGARAALADENLRAGNLDAASRLFRLSIEEAPLPYSDRLFNEVIATIPANVYWRGHQALGNEFARLIESKVEGKVNQLLLLATFYLGTENGTEAKRVAEAAIAADETSSAAHQTLATAHRLNFDLEAAAASFAKAVELDPASTVSRRSLADIKRATGKADEAEAIYREILSVNEKDLQARTGLVLALFDQGKREAAEAEMAKALDEAPGNVVLLAGAAYWYAANKDGDRAVEYARRAIEKDPRYVWSHIALARGLMLQRRPVDAEQVLLSARKYGNFPTLQYEIAAARLSAGFFREAAEELRKSFVIEDGQVRTRLGGRIETKGESFAEAIGPERRASIFAPAGADTSQGAELLKALVEFEAELAKESPDEARAAAAADRFASGSDNMAVHRKLYAADNLLQKNLAADKALDLAKAATAGIDGSLEVANPGAAVMASELYEARNISFARDDFLLIPDVPKQTLSSLMRGRVEVTTGMALLKQGKPEEAAIRFRRALTVFPKDSAWWRSATWDLGTAQQALGKDQEALDTLISSYRIDKPDIAKYLIIEGLYRKVNGNTEGLEEKIGPSPLPNFSAAAVKADVPADAKPVPTDPVEVKEPEPAKPNEASSAEAGKADNPAVSKSESATVEEKRNETEKAAEPKPEPSSAEGKGADTAKPAEAATAELTKVSTGTGSDPSAAVIKKEVSKEEEKAEGPVTSVPAETKPETEARPKPSDAEAKPAGDETKPETEARPKPSDAEAKPAGDETKPETEARPKPSDAEAIPAANNDAAAEQPAALKNASEPKAASSAEAKPGSIFEPIIIQVPGGRRPAAKQASEEPSKVEPTPASGATGDEPAAKPPPTDESLSSGASRPRIVEGKAINAEVPPCTIGVSQDQVSLLNNGGSIALLISIDAGQDVRSVSAVSSSPGDVEVRLEPDIAEISGRSLFVVKSISSKTGVYQISFAAPCGSKDVIVRVR
ncbi:MAG: hypothetical protein AB7V18_10855 [Pyrinomonadaceae bacterium]